jgi:hypothetical protein
MQFTIDTLDRLKSDTENMRTISDEIKLFTAFADIESAFEPIEECWFRPGR